MHLKKREKLSFESMMFKNANKKNYVLDEYTKLLNKTIEHQRAQCTGEYEKARRRVEKELEKIRRVKQPCASELYYYQDERRSILTDVCMHVVYCYLKRQVKNKLDWQNSVSKGEMSSIPLTTPSHIQFINQSFPEVLDLNELKHLPWKDMTNSDIYEHSRSSHDRKCLSIRSKPIGQISGIYPVRVPLNVRTWRSEDRCDSISSRIDSATQSCRSFSSPIISSNNLSHKKLSGLQCLMLASKASSISNELILPVLTAKQKTSAAAFPVQNQLKGDSNKKLSECGGTKGLHHLPELTNLNGIANAMNKVSKGAKHKHMSVLPGDKLTKSHRSIQPAEQGASKTKVLIQKQSSRKKGLSTPRSHLAADGSRTNTHDSSHADVNGSHMDTDNSRTNARGRHTVVSGSHTDADGSRTNARGSRTNARGSHTDADGSRTNARVSRTNARGSRTNADGSRTNARGSRTNARGSRTDADGSKMSALNVRGRHTDVSGSHIDTRDSHIDTRDSHIDTSDSHIDTRDSHIDIRDSHIDTRDSHNNYHGRHINDHGSPNYARVIDSNTRVKHINGRVNYSYHRDTESPTDDYVLSSSMIDKESNSNLLPGLYF